MSLSNSLSYLPRLQRNGSAALLPPDDPSDPAFNPFYQQAADPDPIPQSDPQPWQQQEEMNAPSREQSAQSMMAGVKGSLPKLDRGIPPPMPAPPPRQAPQAPESAPLPNPGMEDRGPANVPITSPVQQKLSQRTAEKLGDVDSQLEEAHANKPAPPKNNLMKRLGFAILASSRLGPENARRLINPNWSEQNDQYNSKISDLQGRQKEQEVSAKTEADVAKKESEAEQKRLLGQEYSVRDADRKQIAQDRIVAQKSERNRKFLADRLKGREDDASYQQESAQKPEGYEFIPDPESSGYGFAVPPAWRVAPKELLPYLPGVKDGDNISHSEYRTAVKSAQATNLENTKDGNKQDKNPTVESLAMLAEQGDTQAAAALKRIAQTRQQSHITVNAGSNLSASALDMAADNYLRTGELPAMGMGGAGTKVQIMNHAVERAKQNGAIADPGTSKALYQGLKSSLAQQQRLYGMTSSFENNTRENMKLLESASTATDRTGSPLINAYLVQAKRGVFGDPAAAKLHDAILTVANEVAKIRSGSLSGVTTDAARREALGSINEAMARGQLNAVLDQMRSEMKNRTEQQQLELKKTESNIRSIGGAPTPDPPNPAPSRIKILKVE